MVDRKMKRVVVKIGSSVIAPKGKLDSSLVKNIVKDILKVEKQGVRIVLVTSGAIACGLNILGYKKKPSDPHSLMALSSLGQISLMDVYSAAFKQYKKLCSQVLLTWDDFDNRKRFMNVRKTVDKLLTLNIIPVINENDVISYEEIRFGDNDRLSALVADLVEANLLIMLSDVEGLFRGQTLIKEVEQIDSQVLSLAKKEDKTHTSGGMFTKLEAARIATSSGIKTVIAYGRKKGVVSSLVKGDPGVGTSFLPSSTKDRARKRWIASSKKIKGDISVDEGAKDALLNKGKSLLNVGIVDVKGSFKKGDAVSIIDCQGSLLGCGLVNYSVEELKRSKSKKLDREVIHRDDFVKGSQGWCHCLEDK